MARLDAYSETAYISVQLLDVAGNFHMEAMSESIEIDLGEKGFETMANLLGGRIKKENPEEDTTITIEGYPVDAGFVEGADSGAGADATVNHGVFNIMHGVVTGTSDSMEIGPSHLRRSVRVAIRFTDQSSVQAEDILLGNTQNLRVIFADGELISAKPSYSDKLLKMTMQFKFPPFDKFKDLNYTVQSTDGNGLTPGDDIAVLADYTAGVPSNTKW